MNIYRMLKIQWERDPDAIAIISPERAPLTYARLISQTEYVNKFLAGMGLGTKDRIAIVLPNGPEMAVAFLSVASRSVAAPLNPDYRVNEFDFYLSDLNAKGLILQDDIDSPAEDAAKKRGIPVIRLKPDIGSESGIFTFVGRDYTTNSAINFSHSDDFALVLHTSGTTSRPKIVPLTHRNICTSAYNIQRTLKLEKNDRCLNVMPLFHIHGLVGALLSSLSAGASIVCTPGFYSNQFFDWINEFHPTWYTAVPTMHQSILSRGKVNLDIIKNNPLRFIRSCSAPLPPKVMLALEDMFNVPVIESYGMTEASHQIASNPLPPGKRKPGSVGLAVGPNVEIMDESGRLLQRGEIGEIVIRGDNVMGGYENNPDANKSAFTNGWFRTGDQGYLDSDNYLYITGRIKEIINRGGEKISPREIDEVIMEHPAVEQVVTFSMPDDRLGEEVAAALVIRENKSVTEKEIQEFVADKLADFKIPRRVVFLEKIPKGPTGKLQRIGLAERLGIVNSSKPEMEFKPPALPTEKKLAEIWSQVLEIEKVGIYDNFFHLGGNSLLISQVISRVREIMQTDLSFMDFFKSPTVADMALCITEKMARRYSNYELSRIMEEINSI